ncbi:MAG: M15 family metallopeptidase, partial [Actinomycetota bacterium]
SAELRRTAPGSTIQLIDRAVTVTGAVTDETANGYEALMGGPVPGAWDRADRFVLVRLKRPGARAAVERAVRSLLVPDQVARVRAQGETPFLRYGDAVLPQLVLKKVFGEFSARPLSTGSLAIDPRWVRENIVTAQVPVIGEVSCHRSVIPQLRTALREAVAAGLSQMLDPAHYGGCYSPRFIDRDPGGRLSHHSWGIAIDVNVAENVFGTKPDQDRRLVEIMERWGFTWGGRWLIPDGMHFEWASFP